MSLFLAAGVIALFIAVLYFVSNLIAPRPLNLKGGHVLVTGGSSGIGKAIAIEVVKKGASVTLLARSQVKLSEAKQEVEMFVTDRNNQSVLCISVDLSRDYSAVEKAIQQAEEKIGPVDMLVNSAGTATSERFEDIPLDQFKHLMDVNYLGSVYATRALLPSMKRRNKGGRIVYVSSQAGQIGLYGFTAYSASKFALRGLAESLQMEVKPHNIHVTLAFPPDTDTPGFAEEQKGKPEETKLISETAGLFQASYVAKTIVNDSLKGKFACHMGSDGYMLACVTSGMSPVTTIMEATQQVLLMSLFRAIALVYLDSFDRIVKKCKANRDAITAEEAKAK